MALLDNYPKSYTRPFPLEQIRNDAENWAADVERELRQSLVSVGAVDTGEGQASIDSLTKIVYGDSIGIWLGFRRYLVMVEKGAGRGYGGKKGSNWKGPDGKIKKTKPTSFGKMNTGERKAMRWFNPVINREIGRLADLAAEHFAVEASKFLIK